MRSRHRISGKAVETRWARYRSASHELPGIQAIKAIKATTAMTAVTDPFDRPPHIPADEWAARGQLAAAYRTFDRVGWAESYRR